MYTVLQTILQVNPNIEILVARRPRQWQKNWQN